MVNELAKRLIFQCFPNHSVTNTLKNTLSGSICHCRFVAAGIGDTSPLARTCYPILLGDNAFISAQQQSKRSDEFKDTPIFSATLSPCHPRNITPAIATKTRQWHARICLPLLPCPISPPLFMSRARQSAEPYRHLIRRNLPKKETAKAEIGYKWRTAPPLPSGQAHPSDPEIILKL